MRRMVFFYWGCGFALLAIIVTWSVLAYILRLWLFIAAATCNMKMRDTALMLGTPVDSRTAYGETPLMVAARAGCRTAVWEFIRRGADVNAADNRGITPLYHAAEVGDAMTVKKLLQSGAHPNSASKVWRTT
ncbi:MAG: ankyrin repeat domain-containing protein, partial [Armatimonadota bacterium]